MANNENKNQVAPENTAENTNGNKPETNENTNGNKPNVVKYKVPDDGTDFAYQRVILNGEPYELKKGETVEVPAGVAEILETREKNLKKRRDALRARKNAAKGL